MSSNFPLISIIIPTYNLEKYLSQCLESMCLQTLKDIEIIVIDDGSTDKTPLIINKYAAKDSRIRAIYKENGGEATARNAGLKIATAPFIMFCDGDDWYEVSMCEKMYNAITKNNVDLVACGTKVYYETNKMMRKHDNKYYANKFIGLQNVTDNLIRTMDVCIWNKIFRHEFLITHNILFPDGLRYDDGCFFNIYMLWCKSIFFIDEKLYNYRRRIGSVMNQTYNKEGARIVDHLRIAFVFYDYLISNNKYEERILYFWSYFCGCYRFAVLNSKFFIHEIHDLAKGFIQRNSPSLSILPFNLRRSLSLIMADRFGKRKFLGGIIGVHEDDSKKRISVFGLRIWTVKYSEHYNEHYLFGFILVSVIKLIGYNFYINNSE